MVEILQGDCLKSLKKLESKSINTCVTSPPYFGLRDYGTAEWKGGDEGCNHSYQVKNPYNKDFNERWGNSPGLKKQESQRHEVTYKGVCKKCGAISKDSQIGLEETPEEFVENLVKVFREVKRVLRDDGTVWLNLGDSFFPNKQLGCIPFKVAIALQDDGWYLRQDIIWHKPNPMPESVRDRCTKSHEYIFLLSKSKKYYYDNEAIKEDSISIVKKRTRKVGMGVGSNIGTKGSAGNNGKRNKRSVWTVTTKPFKGAHFAVFPMDLIEPCVLAGCPKGGTVLDPFGGSGTTGLVAKNNNRNAILLELNPEYIEIAESRIVA
jgi:site-specific DNA-methyltransferase (adenine-specific)